MSIELNHTIVHVKDRWSASRDVGRLLGLPEATAYGPFAELKLDNGVSLDFMRAEGEIGSLHYAFKVADEQFSPIFDRIRAAGLPYWADPHRQQPNRINTNDGGQGVYFPDPDGHNLEILTRDYGSGA